MADIMRKGVKRHSRIPNPHIYFTVCSPCNFKKIMDKERWLKKTRPKLE